MPIVRNGLGEPPSRLRCCKTGECILIWNKSRMEAPEIFLSIIMPAFNRGYLLGESMRSILNQRNVELELIIVDDGSDDDTGSIVREVKDDRVKYIRTENKERGSARNTGAKIASGQYVNYFDSDDIFKPCLGAVQDFIRKNNHPNIVFGEVECISQDKSLIEKIKALRQYFSQVVSTRSKD